MTLEQEQYEELAFYTLQHDDPEFIHQHIVDAYAAQTASEHDKPIKITFALMGLYLFLEKGFTGRQVQLAHMEVARNHKPLPVLVFPEFRGDLMVTDIIAIPAGQERDKAIRQWCISVWGAWKATARQQIIDFLPDKYK